MCRVSTQKEDEKVSKEDALGWVTRGQHFKGSSGTVLLVKAGKTEESEQTHAEGYEKQHSIEKD